ncbi:hypothetical protein ACVW0Y_002772 [Pseudomonas sp. TE3786]
MQIGSTASYPLSTSASVPASLSAPAANPAIPSVTAVAESSSSPDTTVSFSADGTRLAAVEQGAAGATKQSASDPADANAKTAGSDGDDKSPQQEQQERQTISELASRDADVRAHEAAHAAVGGTYAGSPSYTLQQGPDGKSYAVGGEVGIDLSAVSGDPAATISKMEVVMRAALAPIDPSSQDLRVAAEAQGLATAARVELAEQTRSEATEQAQAKREQKDQDQPATGSSPQTADTSASLQLYQSIASPLDSTPLIVAVA